MNWPLVRGALQAAVVSMTGLTPLQVVWRGSLAEKSVVVGTKIVLTANSVGTVGVDEPRLANAENGDDLEVTRVGQRKFTWSIQVETQNQPSGTARVLIDQCRIRMQRESVLAGLLAANVGVSSFLGTTHNDYLGSGREVSVSTMDVLMLAVDIDRDDSIDAGGWIGEVLITSDKIKDPGGVDFDPQISLDVDARDA